MDEKQKQIVELKTKISNLEHELEAAKRALFELGEEGTASISLSSSRVIEGTFNGENMEGPDGKIFPVPANYASKSKLVEGDRLKLTIGDDGSFLFKQIGPAERIKAIGNLKFENNAYFVEVEGKSYHVLYASVTYYKAKPGDRVSIVISGVVGGPKWCALEGIIHNISGQDREAAEQVVESKLMEQMRPVAGTSVEPTSFTPTTDTPNVETVQTSEDAAKNSLGIDDLEIVGPKGGVTPEAVNPQDYVATSQAPIPGSTTVDTRAEAIEELEI